MQPSPPAPRLELAQTADLVVARLADCPRITEENAAAVGRSLGPVTEVPAARVHLDLAGVEYVTSIGLVELIILNKKLRAAGARLTLVNLRPDVRKALASTRLDTVLDVAPAGGPRDHADVRVAC